MTPNEVQKGLTRKKLKQELSFNKIQLRHFISEVRCKIEKHSIKISRETYMMSFPFI